MDYKKAIDILVKMSHKRSILPEEREAVLTAIGVLDWMSRAKSKIKAIKAKKDKSTQW